MHHRMLVTLLTTLGAANAVLGAEHAIDHWARMSKRQDGPTAPDTASDCTFWDTVYDSSMNCQYFESGWGLTHEQFLDYNPSLKDDCSGIKEGNSYCVEVNNGLPRPTTRKTSSTVPTTTAKPSPTGIKKPSPTQSGLIDSCTDFYFAEDNDRCELIVAKYGTFTYDDFVKWNPAVGPTCSGIWSKTYYCVGVPGTPTAKPSATITPTPTGIKKPSPTQSGLIDSCTDFYFAVDNDRCDLIVAKYGTFTYDDFVKWNPAVGPTCSGIWSKTYYCVGVPGTPTARPSATSQTPTPTPTGIQKPSPTREGMIDTCNKFHLVAENENCDTLVKKYGTFTFAQFLAWNPSVGSNCGGLWKDTYFCVGVPGTATPPTTTKPSTTLATTTRPASSTWTMACILQFVNGQYYCVDDPKSCNPNAPPNPQPSPICGCKKWHQVADKENCDTIVSKYGISRANFDKWNPNVNTGGNCKTLWLGYNVCVGI